MPRERPQLSVLVTVVSGGASLARTLASLATRPWMEVLVPLEAGHPDRGGVEPGARLVEVAVPASATTHERYDRRRAAGLDAALGDVIAIVEDHGTPAADWPEHVRDAHARLPHAAIGGVVANMTPAPFQDAVWLCDFGRYAPPQAEGARPTLTDVNVSYKREPLLLVRETWTPRFHEPLVHDALRARGATLWLDPAIVVAEQRPALTLTDAVRERLAWGRLYGMLRAREWCPMRRIIRAAMSLMVPPLLAWRLLRHARGRVPAGRVLHAAPWIALLLNAWCVGEAAGTLSGPYHPKPRKDVG